MASRSLGYLSAILFAVLLVVPITASGQTAACGDENGNGALESADVFYLINHLFAAGPGPANCPRPAPVAKTAQTTCYDTAGTVIACGGTGQDGETQKGVALPSPRFKYGGGNGTVTDNVTGLVWLKDANCFGAQTWANALTSANTLASGACGLTDGSLAGDWRLPNVKELQSLIDYGYSSPALSNAAGTGQWTGGDAFVRVQSDGYWSSSNYVVTPAGAWIVGFTAGRLDGDFKTNPHYVWPVRGGQ